MTFLATIYINLQCQMEQKIQLNYINNELHIGVVDWRKVYLLSPNITPLIPEVDKGRLVYRAKGCNKRLSYKKIKIGLIKTSQWIVEEVPSWLPV